MQPMIPRFALMAGLILVLAACARAAADRAPITGASPTLTVRGEYASVDLDRVDGMSLRDGRLALRGSSKSVSVELPSVADQAKPQRGWALVTETAGSDKRTVTFTHETTLDDFSIDLPASDAPFYYGGLSGRNGEDVLVFAWGAGSQSYWGYVTIGRQSPAASVRRDWPAHTG
jgi:hypothetical protein